MNATHDPERAGMSGDAYRGHLYLRLVQSQVPDTLHEGLVEYLAARRETGSFLRAVLENDLREACRCADVENRVRLYEIVAFLWSYAPAPSWGSKEDVAAWLADPAAPPEVYE